MVMRVVMATSEHVLSAYLYRIAAVKRLARSTRAAARSLL
jgi:hypothetical protein